MLQTFKAFRKDAKIHKVQLPPMPTVEDMMTFTPEKRIEVLKLQSSKIEESKSAYKLAEKRMNVCESIHAVMNPWKSLAGRSHKHFSWCPYDEWFSQSNN